MVLNQQTFRKPLTGEANEEKDFDTSINTLKQWET